MARGSVSRVIGGALLATVSMGLFAAEASQKGQEIVVQDALTALELEALLSDAGLNPTMMKDKATGFPVATGSADGMVFVVRALDCAGVPVRCGQLLLFANFDLGRAVAHEDFRIVNGFNETNVNGRAYVLDGKQQIGVDFIIDMTGGVTGEHIGQRLGRWPGVVRQFREDMVTANTGS